MREVCAPRFSNIEWISCPRARPRARAQKGPMGPIDHVILLLCARY